MCTAFTYGKEKRWRVFVGAIVALGMCMYLIMDIKRFSISEAFSGDYREEPKPVPAPLTDQPALKKILFWDDSIEQFWSLGDFGAGVGREPFVSHNCRVNTCFATIDRDVLHPEDANAVVFAGITEHGSLPTMRSAKTNYVFLYFESPAHEHRDLTLWKDVYNLSMTYRRDSDVFIPSGETTPLSEPVVVTRDFSAGKSKSAAWFVSNCNAQSKRGKLVSEIQKYIDVDIYGNCGPLECPRDNADACFEKLDEDYFFYLSFENSFCKDYVTEKFFNALSHNVVPVVYGGADYSSLAPPNSFVDALQFSTPQALAEHLLALTKNHTAYNEYFAWKQHYRTVMHEENMFCRLCAKLHENNPPQSLDIYDWYQRDACANADDATAVSSLTNSSAALLGSYASWAL